MIYRVVQNIVYIWHNTENTEHLVRIELATQSEFFYLDKVAEHYITSK